MTALLTYVKTLQNRNVIIPGCLCDIFLFLKLNNYGVSHLNVFSELSLYATKYLSWKHGFMRDSKFHIGI